MDAVMPVDLEPGRRIPMSWTDYEALAPDARGEYVDGEFVVSPLPSGRHQDACLRLTRLVEDALPAGVHVRLSWGWKPGPDEFGPDLIVFDETDEDVRYTGIPHLCVEVLSTDRGRDLVRKFAKYAAAGLPRYWVVDPQVPDLTVFELDDRGGYRQVIHLTDSERAPLDLGPATVTLAPADLVR